MVACRGDGEKNMKTEKYVDGFIANDAKTLNEILTNEYTLIELEDYFGKKIKMKQLVLTEMIMKHCI